MITKLLMILFTPSRWEVIETRELTFQVRNEFSLWEWRSRSGKLYVLKNQFGDIKFKKVMYGPEGY